MQQKPTFKFDLFFSATVICPWSVEGACAQDGLKNRVFSPSFPPENVVDTLGAGDTFIASTIFGLSSKWSLADSITFGCQVAGIKVGVKGWEQLRISLNTEVSKNLLKKFYDINVNSSESKS